ncbi:MAG: hypothetical protein MRY83_03160 [Flavobacteriales bacterium]|nr:hypothetical protein [Flavobacteriales bacterium]
MKHILPILLLFITNISIAQNPSKEIMIDQLYEVFEALDKKEFSQATKHFLIPESVGEQKAMQALSTFIEKKEISNSGIKVLAEHGEYGPLELVFPERGKAKADRAGVDIKKCYGYRYQEANVMGLWESGKFKFFRMDDLGKIESPGSYSKLGFKGLVLGLTKDQVQALGLAQTEEKIDNMEWGFEGYSYASENSSFADFMNLDVQNIYLSFENDKVGGIFIVLKTDKVKSLLLSYDMEKYYGDTDCSYSVAFDPAPYYCTWDFSESSILSSNMDQPGGGPGDFVRIKFSSNL